MTSGISFNKTIVPIESLNKYISSPQWKAYKFFIESQIANVGKKSNYKKFAKIMKKAVKYLPQELEVIVRAERSEGK